MPTASPPSAPSSSPRIASRLRLDRGVGALLVIAVLHALLTTGALLLGGSLLALFLLIERMSLVVVSGLAMVGLLAWAYRLLSSSLRRVDGPDPGVTAVLLTASTVLASVQTVSMSFWLDTGAFWTAAVASAVQGAVIVTVLSLARDRAVTRACAAVCGVALVHLLGFLGLAALG